MLSIGAFVLQTLGSLGEPANIIQQYTGKRSQRPELRLTEGQGRIGETSRRWNQVDMRGGNRGLEYCAPSSYHTAGAKFVLNGFEFLKTGKIRASWGKCSNNKFSRISSQWKVLNLFPFLKQPEVVQSQDVELLNKWVVRLETVLFGLKSKNKKQGVA